MTNTEAQLLPTGLNNSRVARWCMYGLLWFPIIDYALRFSPAHPLAVIWDKVVLIALVVLAASRLISGYRPQWFTWHKYAGWFIVLLLGIMFAGLAQPLFAIQGFRADVFYILYAFLIPFVVRSEDVPKLLHAGAIVAILIGVHGIYQYVTKAPMPRGWVDASEHVRTRVYSVLQSPNELGAYMALVLPLLAGLFFYEQNKWRKRIYLFGVIVCVVTLFFTGTRAAWLSLAIAILIMAVLFERRLLIGLVVLAVIAFFLPPIQHRLGTLFSPVYWLKSVQSGRIFKWITAYDKMATNPLFGYGLGRFGGQVSSQYQNGIYSDNFYAKILAESGIVGLTLFMTMHLSLIREILSKFVRRISGRERYVFIGVTTGLVAVLVHNSMENIFEFAPLVLTYFIYATLLLVWGVGLVRQPVGPDNSMDTDSSATGGAQ